MFGFPLFIILTVVHGADTWLNYGFPVGSVTILISLLIYLFFWIRKIYYQCKGTFKVESVDICESGSFIYFHLAKPDYFKYKEGQYVFMNCPQISKWEWHPFSIASSEMNPQISFLIKNNGDWTNKLIQLFKKKLSNEKNKEVSY